MGKSPEPHPVHEDPGLAGLEGLSQIDESEDFRDLVALRKVQKDPTWVMWPSSEAADEHKAIRQLRAQPAPSSLPQAPNTQWWVKQENCKMKSG